MGILIPVWLALDILVYALPAAQLHRAEEAQPLGITLSTIISFGDAYTSPIELYDAKITVLDILRGSEAWSFIRSADRKNRPPASDSEYVVARIKFEFSARSKPGDKSYNLHENQFTAISSEGVEYAPPDLRIPKSGLNRTLRSGDATIGWIAFIVARDDPKPFMVFKENVEILLRNGAGIRFRLYR